jgi:arsenate reductase
MATVLFVCLQNAGRSQMSQALLTRAANGAHWALSAGTTPAAHVHPEVIEVMRELDIDLSKRTPQLLTRELASKADVVVTMGCGDQCPYIPGWASARPTDAIRQPLYVPLHGVVIGGYTRDGDAEAGSRCESDTVLATVTREFEPHVATGPASLGRRGESARPGSQEIACIVV